MIPVNFEEPLKDLIAGFQLLILTLLSGPGSAASATSGDGRRGGPLES